jgi:oxygen-independent coproporphyrinogen III oxidase
LSEKQGIYVHIPFCVKKCSYCDFYSSTDFGQKSAVVTALPKEIHDRADKTAPVDTIYFGGGTPSILSPGEVETILDAIYSNFDIIPDSEITVEVNPGTIDKDYLKSLMHIGVNRISIGVQSFDDERLAFLQRIHTAKEAQNSIIDAIAVGFENMGIDLIYGLPSETESVWKKELEQALTFQLPHLSCYMLTFEPGTPMTQKAEKGLFKTLGNQVLSDLFIKTSTFLTGHDYTHYEISNFALGSQNRSRHNTKYWHHTPYLGFGPSAYSFDSQNRSWNHPDIKTYISELSSNRLPVQGREILTREQKMMETIMLGLRTFEGIHIKQFEHDFQIPFNEMFQIQIENIQISHLGNLTDESFSLTLEGRARLNSITEAFSEII